MLGEIINKNAQLIKYPEIIPMLYQLDDFIPFNRKDSFYKNLVSLKVKSSTDDSSHYSLRDNTIYIRTMFSGNINDSVSREEAVKIELIRRKQDIFHELMHMASTRRVRTNDTVYSGFLASCLVNNTYYISNNNINEGFTQLFTELFYPKYVSDYAYLDYASITSIITMIVGVDDIKELYFRGGCISGLKEKLSDFTSEERINHLFSMIEKTAKKNHPRTLVIYDILKNDLLDMICNAFSYWVDNGVFDSYQDGRYFVYNNINPLIKNLLSMMRTDKVEYASAKEDLIQICNTYQGKLINKIKILKK